MTPRRIVVLGVSGAGKSTLSRPLAALVGGPHVELDAIAHGPGWTTPPVEEFRARLAAATAGPAWVVDGNYVDRTAEVLWHRADLLVWLDQPLRVVVPRLLRRSLGRIVRRTELWNGNREGLNALVGSDSVIAWAIKQHRGHRTAHPARLAGLPHLRLRSTAEADRWLTAFGEAVRRGPGPTPP
ncbi:adenylate kinase [Saccharothrix longispora]|uniref:adenylate kinase n=1 Tax=Saccharothrix longispora TaxID=33920 RepID=UPI0028FD37B4|nr:adenylate kinase [Saccharothrix longispora]MBY8847275.1 adenylate kinase [Saccharothrix sp. MB29]MDU0293206.1 adenylate kinase [Saccharothrix longispora]